jgi:hypothetical protein
LALAADQKLPTIHASSGFIRESRFMALEIVPGGLSGSIRSAAYPQAFSFAPHPGD